MITTQAIEKRLQDARDYAKNNTPTEFEGYAEHYRETMNAYLRTAHDMEMEHKK